MSRLEELAEKRGTLLQQLQALEEKHRIREFTLAKMTVEGGLTAIDREAQSLGFRFKADPHTDCGGTIVSDDEDHCLRCGKSGAIMANFDKLGNGRYRFREEWDERGDLEWLYQTISQDSRYGHYVRIPGRICRCLDYFNVSSNRRAVKERLHSYYLFIGVVDDVIDSSRPEAGQDILKQLDSRTPIFNEETSHSEARLVTEILKCHISCEIYPSVLVKLEELYRAVIGERKSRTMRAYIEQRKAIGCLTAEVSYLLIRPLLESEHKDLCVFLQKVGEVGCLIDSVIDLRADNRGGLLGFRPTLKDYLKLTGQTLHEGLRILLKHPRLVGLFLESVSDDLLDQFRARKARPVADQSDDSKNRYVCGRAA
jgi:hypothetical protein